MLLDEQKKRYARNLALAEIGQIGQSALIDAKVLVVGAGGLGSPVLLYLAAAGVGNIGIIDSERVELSNLQRQVLFDMAAIGHTKTSAAKSKLLAINPDINISVFKDSFNENNAEKIALDFDIVADCSDNFSTRFLINKTAIKLKKTLVSSAVIGFKGHIAVFKPHADPKNNPCYQCFCPEEPPENLLPICSTSGVLGSVAGTVGSIAASHIIKEVIFADTGNYRQILFYDGMKDSLRKVSLSKNPDCACCSIDDPELSRGKKLVNIMRGAGDVKMTTDEIMSLTRDE